MRLSQPPSRFFYIKLNDYYWYIVDRDSNGYRMLQAQVYATPSATIETLQFLLFPVDPKNPNAHFERSIRSHDVIKTYFRFTCFLSSNNPTGT